MYLEIISPPIFFSSFIDLRIISTRRDKVCSFVKFSTFPYFYTYWNHLECFVYSQRNKLLTSSSLLLFLPFYSSVLFILPELKYFSTSLEGEWMLCWWKEFYKSEKIVVLLWLWRVHFLHSWFHLGFTFLKIFFYSLKIFSFSLLHFFGFSESFLAFSSLFVVSSFVNIENSTIFIESHKRSLNLKVCLNVETLNEWDVIKSDNVTPLKNSTKCHKWKTFSYETREKCLNDVQKKFSNRKWKNRKIHRNGTLKGNFKLDLKCNKTERVLSCVLSCNQKKGLFMS